MQRYAPSAQDAATEFLQRWMESRELVQALNLETMRSEDLSATLFTVLNLLDDERAITVALLADRMNVHASTVVRSLDVLEKRELVLRERNPNDRRELRVTLTKAGQSLRKRSRALFTEHLKKIFNVMSATDRDALLRGYAVFVEHSRAYLQAVRKDTKGK